MSTIKELRELLARASPPRWIAGETRKDGTAQVYRPNDGPMRVIVPVAETTEHDAAIIAAAVNALPDLLRVVEAVASSSPFADMTCTLCGCDEYGPTPRRHLESCGYALARKLTGGAR